jgi:hypothetical protein
LHRETGTDEALAVWVIVAFASQTLWPDGLKPRDAATPPAASAGWVTPFAQLDRIDKFLIVK